MTNMWIPDRVQDDKVILFSRSLCLSCWLFRGIRRLHEFDPAKYFIDLWLDDTENKQKKSTALQP
jgi:hypothetical protein